MILTREHSCKHSGANDVGGGGDGGGDNDGGCLCPLPLETWNAADLNAARFEMQHTPGCRPAQAPWGRRSHLHHLGAIDSPAGPRLQRREWALCLQWSCPIYE